MTKKKVIKRVKKEEKKVENNEKTIEKQTITNKKCPLIRGECTQKFCRAWDEQRNYCKIEKYFEQGMDLKNKNIPGKEEI